MFHTFLKFRQAVFKFFFLFIGFTQQLLTFFMLLDNIFQPATKNFMFCFKPLYFFVS